MIYILSVHSVHARADLDSNKRTNERTNDNMDLSETMPD